MDARPSRTVGQCEVNLQWKGINACYDFYCPCNPEFPQHVDGMCAQSFTCGQYEDSADEDAAGLSFCGRTWHLANKAYARPGPFFHETMPPTYLPDVAEIRAALECLPTRCRYHGDATEPPGGHYPRKSCCDAGLPAHRRKLALAALAALEQAAAERDRTGTRILICSSCGTQACANGVLMCDEAKTASFLYYQEAPDPRPGDGHRADPRTCPERARRRGRRR